MMTNPELDAIFQEYAQLAAQADQLFERVKNQFPEEVKCCTILTFTTDKWNRTINRSNFHWVRRRFHFFAIIYV